MYRKIDPKIKVKSMAKVLRTIFKRAGSIREAQVHLEHLGESSGSKKIAKLRSIAAHNVQSETDNFIHEIADLPPQPIPQTFEVIRSNVSGMTILAITSKLDHYLREAIDELVEVNRGGVEREDQLHAYRTRLKQFYYNILYFLQRGDLLSTFQQDLKLIDELQEELGRWHDQDLLLRKMMIENVNKKHVQSTKIKKEETLCRISRKQRNVGFVLRNFRDYIPTFLQNLNRNKIGNPPINVMVALQ